MVEATRTTRPSARSWLLDMDGVLAHEERAVAALISRAAQVDSYFRASRIVASLADMVDQLQSPLSSAVAGA